MAQKHYAEDEEEEDHKGEDSGDVRLQRKKVLKTSKRQLQAMAWKHFTDGEEENDSTIGASAA